MRVCLCVLWDRISETRLSANVKKKREVKENRREKETEECCILDFVVFLVDVAVCK